MSEQFKFPDELPKDESLQEDSFKVEVVDDTPEEDRGRKPLPREMIDELDKDDLEEYSDKVKKRISQARKAYHDERREKERYSREREEALQFAQRAYEENKLLKQRLGTGEKVFIHEVTKAATTELTSAKEKLKQAYETGDAEQIADAQELLTDAKLKMKEIERFQPSLQDTESGVQTTHQAQAPQNSYTPDQKAEAWRDKNRWFGVDEEMTALALGLHEKLVRSGVDPRSDDYYRRVDMTMRKRFPENFSDDDLETQEERSSSRRNSTVVAPATRSTAPRQVRISASEAAIAKRLGLTPEAYAREKLKLENFNG